MSALSTADEEKFPMDEEAEQIGIVTKADTDAQIAYVKPDPDIAGAVPQGLSFGDASGDDIEVPVKSVETVTDSELRVTKGL